MNQAAKIYLEVGENLEPELEVKGSMKSVATLLLHAMFCHPMFARSVALAYGAYAQQQDSQSTTNQNQNHE
jgi:hypothetical protein